MANYSEDVSAVLNYFQNVVAKNSEAQKIKDEFYTFLENMSWYEKNISLSDNTWNQITEYRDNYNKSNGDELGFEPRKMTKEDQAFIDSLVDKGSFINALSRDAAKIVGSKPTDPFNVLKGKIVIFSGILAGLGALYIYAKKLTR